MIQSRHVFPVLFCLLAAGAASAEAPQHSFPENTLILGPDAPEMRFFDKGAIGKACTGAVGWDQSLRCISLPDVGDAVEFHLATIRRGRYLVAVQCRTGHQASGWEYCTPEVKYAVSVDGESAPMIRGQAEPHMRFKGKGWYDYSGWIVSRDFVELEPHDRLKVATGDAYAYVLQVVLLTPQQAFGCDWLAPDVMGKTLETLEEARGRLAGFGEKVGRLGLAAEGYGHGWVMRDYRPALYDDFGGEGLDESRWVTWTDSAGETRFAVEGGAARVEMTSSSEYADAQIVSREAWDFFDRRTEFTFSQSTSQAYAYTRNYITTNAGRPGCGFGIWYGRYVGGDPWRSRVKLYEYGADGQTAAELYDSGEVSGMGGATFSLVLDGDRWEFYWDGGSDGARTLRGSGAHGVTREEIGDGVHLGFGLNFGGRSGGPYTATMDHAAAVQADPAARLAVPDFSPVMVAFDEEVQGFGERLERWRSAYAEAQKSGDEAAIVALQESSAELREQADSPLSFVAEPARSWCMAVAERFGALPAVPETGDYHSRWAKVLGGWMSRYAADLSATAEGLSGKETARRLGRAGRLLDLEVRYRREVAAARPVATPTVERAAAADSAGEPVSVCLNGLWEFSAGNNPAAPPSEWETIRVPHGPWRIAYGNFFNAGKTWDPENHVGWYRTRFFVPAEWSAEGTSVRFEAVFHYAEVYVNGVYCGGHLGGFDRFTVDLSSAVRPGQVNEMAVMVKDTFDTKTDPSRNTREDYSANYVAVNDLWGVNYGGIWQDVYLDYRPSRMRIADVAISTPVREGVRLNATAEVRNTSSEPRNAVVRFSVIDEDGETSFETPAQPVGPGASAEFAISQAMPEAKLWGIGGEYGKPHLYRLKTEVVEGGQVADERYDPFGFSQLWIEGDRFVLNGRPLFLAGGGVWYLQEEKFPLGNRFYYAQLLRWDRRSNVNLHRIHRHGDMTQQWYAEAAEMGMLMEQEVNPTGFDAAPEDAMGVADFGDPVWQANIREYYRRWSAKHRNWPCIGLTSVENETFSYQYNEELMELGLEMARTVRESDPLRIPDFHGNHMMMAYPGPEFVNAHYDGSRNIPTLRESSGGRPIVNGEHNMGGHDLANNRDRAVAAQGEQSLADFWRSEIQGYLDYGAAGLFVFVPAFQSYCTTSDWRKSTPWGDLFQDLSPYSAGDDRWPCNFSAEVEVPWPSLSGPDAKAERVKVSASRCTLNWFDPSRPTAVTNKVFDALRETFPPMPAGELQRCQEALIAVVHDGAGLAGATVILEPADGQPVSGLGAATDPNGTAWIVPRLPGEYTVRAVSGAGTAEGRVTLGRYVPDAAGYEQVLVRLRLEIR